MRARTVTERQFAAAIVGRSPASVRLRAEIERVAPYSSSVLITGPSGTGKELIARQIHARSPRASQPFIPVDCAALSGELMSSQLFGHVAGAFTGANCEALGCFRAAHHGTIFLDEIGELEYSFQARLLRVLQEHVVTPVGSHQGQPVDVRVIAATNRHLRSDVQTGRFREDLYYRLDVVHLRTTALRDRPEDITELAMTFLGQLADEGLPACWLAPDASAALLEFDWPGNVRQLRNVLEQAAVESEVAIITTDLLHRIISLSLDQDRACCALPVPQAVARSSADPPLAGNEERSCWPTLESMERQHIARTLAHTFYNRSAAARLLGLTRQTLLRRMKRFGLLSAGKDGRSA